MFPVNHDEHGQLKSKRDLAQFKALKFVKNRLFIVLILDHSPVGTSRLTHSPSTPVTSVFLVQLQNRSESIAFRYCFPNGDKAPNATSFLSIGPIEKEFLPKTDINEMVYTPLRSDLYNLYGFEKVVLNLTDISVAGQRLDIDINALNSPAILEEVELPAFNITILDSGTTFTRLPPSVVSIIQGAFNNATNLNLNSMLLDLEAGCAPLLCFEATEDQQFALSFPSLSYFFPKYGVGVHDEIEVVVPGDGMLIRYNNKTICLPICGVHDNAGNETVNIISNRDQRNLLVEYDYEKLVVGFQRTVCGFEE
ncbi:hypothetical protein R1sor_004092 [Riccia sorocarpa]|uniref:Peptidase A1 domain-containing protein n=1 Tax=Riccia sorocarpa TaxID=122646 RepID=A0ABD3H3J2_9MARC